MQTERVCLHSQTLSIIAAFGLLLLFLFGARYKTSAIIGSFWLPNVQINHIKHLLYNLDLLFWHAIATDESVTKS